MGKRLLNVNPRVGAALFPGGVVCTNANWAFPNQAPNRSYGRIDFEFDPAGVTTISSNVNVGDYIDLSGTMVANAVSCGEDSSAPAASMWVLGIGILVVGIGYAVQRKRKKSI